MFTTDKNRGLAHRGVTLLSRFTWESLQTSIGFLTAHFINTIGLRTNTKLENGILFVGTGSGTWGLTLGSTVLGGLSVANKVPMISNNLRKHEYGHTIQSRRFGPFYYFVIAAPSFVRAGIWGYRKSRNKTSKKYEDFYTEKWANKLSAKYFLKNQKRANKKKNKRKKPKKNANSK